MANDIDMWNDLEDMEKDIGKSKSKKLRYDMLWDCYVAKYIDGNEKLAEKFKKKYYKKYKEWGNYY